MPASHITLLFYLVAWTCSCPHVATAGRPAPAPPRRKKKGGSGSGSDAKQLPDERALRALGSARRSFDAGQLEHSAKIYNVLRQVGWG